jgi:hypothetical protein
MKNYSRTVITQYQTSPVMNGLLSDWNTDLDPEANLKLFYDGIWNITTATGYGLDVWGRIVGTTRNIKVGQTFEYLGFEESFGSRPFGSGIFYAGEGSTPDNITLSDADFRSLIKLKAFANLSNCSAYSLNTILAQLYADRGACYALDLGNMMYELVFHFTLTPEDFAILGQSGVILRPAGTTYSIVELP